MIFFGFIFFLQNPLCHMGISRLRTCPCRRVARNPQETILGTIAVQCTEAEAPSNHPQIRCGKWLVFTLPWIGSFRCDSFATLSVRTREEAPNSNASIYAVQVRSHSSLYIQCVGRTTHMLTFNLIRSLFELSIA